MSQLSQLVSGFYQNLLLTAGSYSVSYNWTVVFAGTELEVWMAQHRTADTVNIKKQRQPQCDVLMSTRNEKQ